MNLSDPLFSHTSQGSMFSSVRISTKFSFILRQKYAFGPLFPCLTKNSLLCDGYVVFLSTPSLLILNWRAPLSFPPVNIPLTFFKFNFDFILEYTWFTVLHFKNDTNDLIYKTDADWQNLKTNLCLPKGKGAGKDKLGVWDQHIHTTICKI